MGRMSQAAISVRGLAKRYGEIEAVRGIDFEVRQGETFGFLGPNGAGKTTTINMLCTLARPTAGAASVAGHDVAKARDEVRRSIGLVFQDTTLDGYLTAERNLRFHAELYGVPRSEIGERMRQVLELVGLWDRRDSRVQTFSGGMMRRLEIARGLLHSPRVLFLDEPTIGLDIVARQRVREFLLSANRERGMTLLLTSHDLTDIERLCSRILIIDRGRLIFDGDIDTLKARYGKERVLVVDLEEPGPALQLDGARVIRIEGPRQWIAFDGERLSAAQLTAAAAAQAPLRDLTVQEPEIEDVVRRIYQERA